MSMCYWMNEGVGVRGSDIYWNLDKHKCFLAVKSQLPDEDINEDKFDLDDYLHGEVFQNIGDFLCHLDDDGIFTYGDDGDGQSYFLYPPSYPWNRSDNEPQTLAEVHEKLIKVILKVTNLSMEEAEELIDDDIYEYGCG